MYVGRIVAVGRTRAGRLAGLYRVSSRSFPNRQARRLDQAVAIVPKPGHEQDIFKNPYIAYNCLRLAGRFGVVTNGSHTDHIAEKLAAGYGPRDALASVLGAMDYEHDSLNTPRIAAVVDSGEGGGAWLGIVTREHLLVRAFAPAVGEAFYVATYEHTFPGSDQSDRAFDAADAAGACQYVLGRGVFAALERPVSAACLVATAAGQFDVAIADVTPPANP